MPAYMPEFAPIVVLAFLGTGFLLAVSVLLMVYLLYALLMPEKF